MSGWMHASSRLISSADISPIRPARGGRRAQGYKNLNLPPSAVENGEARSMSSQTSSCSRKRIKVGDEVTTILERVHNVRESTGMGEPKRMA